MQRLPTHVAGPLKRPWNMNAGRLYSVAGNVLMRFDSTVHATRSLGIRRPCASIADQYFACISLVLDGSMTGSLLAGECDDDGAMGPGLFNALYD